MGLVDHLQSLKAKLTPKAEVEDIDHEDLVGELCNDATVAKAGSEVMINVMKVKETEIFEKYFKACLFSFFPSINTRIWEVGTPKSDYWDSLALVEYSSRAGFCKMVLSKEYQEVFMHKVKGLED